MDSLATTQTSTLFSLQDIHVEVSSKCTLKCPRCPRTELDPDGLNKEISLKEFKQAFPVATLEKVKRIIFCGDIGDPIYARDFLPIVGYIKSSSAASVVIVTNGSYRDPAWWALLGSYLNDDDQVTFSVDGWDQESNEKYRVNSNFESIVTGMQTLRANTTAVMNWSVIYFKFNEDRIGDIVKLASELGFDKIETVRSSKFDGRYAVNGIDLLKPTNIASGSQYEKNVIHLTNRNIMHRFTIDAHPWARCLNHAKELFVNVDGLVFPCPWFNSGYQENDFVEKYKDQLSIKTRPIEEVLSDNMWGEFLTRLEVMPLEICKLKCYESR